MSKNLTEVNNKISFKTGFEQSLEGEQTWPPKTFSIKCKPCSSLNLDVFKVPVKVQESFPIFKL